MSLPMSSYRFVQSHESAAKAGADGFQLAPWEPFRGLFLITPLSSPRAEIGGAQGRGAGGQPHCVQK